MGVSLVGASWTIMLRLFGAPRVDDFDATVGPALPKRLFVLVALLRLEHSDAAARADLAAMLWEDSDAGRANASLRHLLLATHKWQARNGAVAIEVRRDLVLRGPRCLGSDLDAVLAMEDIASVEGLNRLLDLYRGDLLEGLPELGARFDAWLERQRERLRDHVVALALSGAQRIGGRAGEAALRQLLRQLPYDERIARALMSMLSSAGDRNAALVVFEALQTRLRDEVGMRPEAETVRLAHNFAAVPAVARPLAATAGLEPLPISRAQDVAKSTVRSAIPRLMILLPEKATRPAERPTRRLAGALIEDVTTSLCRLQSLAVIAPHTAARVELIDARSVALEHRIDYVVETSLMQRGAEGSRLEIKLIHVDTAELLWTEAFGFSDLRRPQVLADLAHWLAAVVTNTVERAEMRFLDSAGPLAAYRHYLMGRNSLNVINLETIRRARKWFLQSIHLNPHFAPAHSWLAHCAILEWMVFSHSGPELLHRAGDAAQLAIDIDPTDGNGHRELGRAALFLGELDESLELFAKAERLAPHHADLLADYADTLMHNSKPLLAKERIDQALALNPIAPDVYYWIAGGISFFCGAPADALQLLKKMRRPDQAFKLMAASAALAGDSAQATLYRQRALNNDPDFDLRKWTLRLPQRERVHLDMYAAALRAAGFA